MVIWLHQPQEINMPVLNKHHLGVFCQLESPLLTTLTMNNITVSVRPPHGTSPAAPCGNQDVTHTCSDGLARAYLPRHISHLSPLLAHAAFMLQLNQPVFCTSSCFACLCPFTPAPGAVLSDRNITKILLKNKQEKSTLIIYVS